MAIYAVVDDTGAIINRIILDNPSDWQIPAGQSITAEADIVLEIGGTFVDGVYTPPPPAPVIEFPPQPQSILSQDLMAQFTADDAALIRAAVAGNAQFWLLWSAMQAQKDPMLVTNARFLTGWAALVQVLGTDRMAAIAAALNVTIG